MDLQGKRLLLLAGQGVHCKVVEAAKEMGVHTIVTDYLQPEQSPAKQIADESALLSILDVDEIVDYCRTHAVDGAMNFCNDPATKALQQVNGIMGYPNIGTAEQIEVLTNKVAFKKFCREHDVDVIPEYSEDDIDAGNIAYPVFVKPIDSRGSRGTAICHDREELLAAIPAAKSESSDGSCIIEKYIPADHDMTITYLVIDGEPHLIMLGDRYMGSREAGLQRQISSIFLPSQHTAMYMERVNDRMINMIRALGIQNGPIFIQGFVDGDTVRMYDPGARFPGNEYERILRRATGLNPMKSMITYFLTGRIDDPAGIYCDAFRLNGKRAMQYMLTLGPGVISRFDGIDTLRADPRIIDVQQKRYVGETVIQTGDVKHRALDVSVLVDTVDELRDVIRFIQGTVVCEDENGRNMIVSAFSADRLTPYDQ